MSIISSLLDVYGKCCILERGGWIGSEGRSKWKPCSHLCPSQPRLCETLETSHSSLYSFCQNHKQRGANYTTSVLLMRTMSTLTPPPHTPSPPHAQSYVFLTWRDWFFPVPLPQPSFINTTQDRGNMMGRQHTTNAMISHSWMNLTSLPYPLLIVRWTCFKIKQKVTAGESSWAGLMRSPMGARRPSSVIDWH